MREHTAASKASELVPAASVQLVRQPAPVGSLEEFSACFSSDEFLDLAELDKSINSTIEARHAKNTRANYGYWMARFRKWLEDPATRWRGKGAPAVVDPQLTPVTPIVERSFARWVTDMVDGPDATDLAREKWEERGGPMAPSTFSLIVSALAAEAENAGAMWTPTAGFRRWRQGMVAQLSEDHEVSKARPLRIAELRTICQHLVDTIAPDVVRDAAVVELFACGLSAAEIASLTRGSIQGSEGLVEVLARGALHTLSATGAGAVRAYTDMRAGIAADDLLFELTPSNRRAHVRKILMRLARAVGRHGWKPTAGLDDAMARSMRAALGSGVLGRGEVKAARDRALLLVGWGAALRRSEIAALKIRHVTVTDDGLRVLVAKSKSDQLGRGVLLGITAGAHRPTDPRSAVMEWMHILSTSGCGPDDSLWPALDRLGRPTGPSISGADVSDIVRAAVVAAGIETEEGAKPYSGHSLRRGFMTTAAEAGVPPLEIQRQSRHKSLAMVAAYTDEANLIQQSITSMLGL